MSIGTFRCEPGTYVPFGLEKYPDYPFKRLVEVEVEDSSKGRFRFDDSYPYLDNSFNYKWNRFLGFFVQWFAVALINRFKYGVKVADRKNYRKYRKHFKKGAIAICNHVFQFDAVAVFQAVRRFRKMWIPMYAKHFNGKDSWFIINCGGIPVPETPAGMRKFDEAFDEYARRGDWFLIFPEAVRWDFYTPVRPFRKGAFTMAWKYDRPIVPCVISWRPRRGLYKLFGPADMPCATIHVGEAVFPDKSVRKQHDIIRMREEAHAIMEKMAGISENPWKAIPEDE